MGKNFPRAPNSEASEMILDGFISVRGKVVSVSTHPPTVGEFLCDIINPDSGVYEGHIIVMTSGVNKGNSQIVEDYYAPGDDGSDVYGTINLADKLSAAPANGDTFVILSMLADVALVPLIEVIQNNQFDNIGRSQEYNSADAYYEKSTTGNKADTARFSIGNYYSLMAYIKALVEGLLKPSWIVQPDAVLSQSSPVQGDYYTILSSTNVWVRSITVKVAATETLEVRVQIDGQEWSGGSSCTGGSDYSAIRDVKTTLSSDGMVLVEYIPLLGDMIGSAMQGRGVIIDVRKTSNNAPSTTLYGRVVWSQFDPSWDM